MSSNHVFRLGKLTGRTKLLFASRHNKRTIQAEMGADSHIDCTKTGGNFTLHGPDSPEGVAQLWQKIVTDAAVPPLRRDAVRAIELLFCLPVGSAIDTRQFFLDCLDWSAEHFGGIGNVLSADVHMDEAAPHMHVLLIPLIGNRLNGSAMAGNRMRLKALLDDFHGRVGARYGLSKAQPRLSTQIRKKTAQNVIQRVLETDDPALKSSLWPALRDSIDRDPQPYAELLDVAIATTPAKPLRTMAQIFTSKGKGSVWPRPIGFDISPIGFHTKRPPDQNLSCVGDGFRVRDSMPSELSKFTSAGDDADESGRVVDRSDVDFNGWQDDADTPPAWD